MSEWVVAGKAHISVTTNSPLPDILLNAKLDVDVCFFFTGLKKP